MTNRFAKPALIGATVTVVFTIVVQSLARFFGHGESAVGWFLMLPWFAIYSPAVSLARVLGIDCRVGDVYEIHTGLFTWMLFVNAIIGAVVALVMRSVYIVFTRVT